MTTKRRFSAVLSCAAFGLLSAVGFAQLNRERGNGPDNIPQLTFYSHRLSTDHAEGIAVIDMNGDGRPDLLSGAYWYENPGPQGGEWKQHLYRKVGIVGEFVSDCGEWTVDVNHDGAPDVVSVGWMTDGLFWYENPKKLGAEWTPHLIAHTIETEGGAMADLNGDGKPDLALAHYGRSGLFWVDFAGAEPKVHMVGTSEQDGHGEMELIAGKRYRGNDGGDPGSYEPLAIYYYKIDRKTGQFTRFPISLNGTAGAGTQFVIADLDGDGDIDIATAGKTGVHFF